MALPASSSYPSSDWLISEHARLELPVVGVSVRGVCVRARARVCVYVCVCVCVCVCV